VTPDDDGFTLAEVLVALAILAIASVALVGGMGNLIVSSSVHRGFSSTDTLARAYIEDVQRLAQNAAWNCNTTFTPSTNTAGFDVTPSWAWVDASTGAVTNCSGYAAARCPAESAPYPPECTPGVMRLSLTVTLPGASGHTSVRTDTTAYVRRSNG
jgi:prepilin-type N-terminal cleavage/methylation domain-containing protein